MTVLIMEPVSLELNKIQNGHNSATDLAQTVTLMAHRTARYIILDGASVLMVAPELPEPYVGWRCFVAKKLADYHVFQNMAWLSDLFRTYLFFPFRLCFLNFGIRTGMPGTFIASWFGGRNWMLRRRIQLFLLPW